MGDYPRWVDNHKVDSAAMYQAYLEYHIQIRKEVFQDETEEEWAPVWWGHLHFLLHRMTFLGVGAPHAAPERGVKTVNCTQRPCLRCAMGRGGYQFRWYSLCWAKQYNLMKREGAWAAPEPRQGERILDCPRWIWVPQHDQVRAAF